MIDDLYYKPIITFAVSLFCIFFYLARKQRRRMILSDCKEVIGTVIDQHTKYISGRTVYPVIKYQVAPDEHIVQTHTDGRYPKRYEIFDEVVIQYSISNPKEYLIKGDNVNWFDLLFLLLGIAGLLYAVFLFYNIYFQTGVNLE